MRNKWYPKRVFLVIPFLLLYAFIILKNAWLCDDAYITLRVADNFISGYGLTWNIFERVQAYTHTLWLFLISAVYIFTREAYFTMIFTSVAVSFAAVALYAFKVARTKILAVIGIIALSFSSAFVDYSTSGLENPLSFLILALFLYVYFNSEFKLQSTLTLSLIATFGALNRMDMLLLFLPMLGFVFWKNRGMKAAARVFLGFLPLILWMVFSLIYYGSIFPNTAYAKLNTGLSMGALIQHGGQYLYTSLLDDLLTVIIIITSLVVPFLRRKPVYMMVSLGILLYIAYIVKIGGCYMAGRHLAVPFFAGVILLSQYRRLSKYAIIPAAVLILAFGIFNSRSPLYASGDESRDTYPLRYGITDERSWLAPTHSLTNNMFGRKARLSSDWVNEGKAARRNNIRFKIGYAIGIIGYYSGPQVKILDINALSDPLLARLELYPDCPYRVGHFTRMIPPGYMETVKTGRNMIADSSLAEYYEHIALITQGALFDWNRIKEAVALDLGLYSHLVENYQSPHVRKIPIELLQTGKRPGTKWNRPDNFIYENEGIQVVLPKLSHAARFELSYDADDTPFRIVYLSDGREITEQVVAKRKALYLGLNTLNIKVPDTAIESGYDGIHIYSDGGARPYVIGHIRLIDTGTDR